MNTTNNTNSKHDQSYLNASKNAPVPCEVIRDLLILYEDDVCSEESSRIIKEHIEDCAGCRKAYEQAKETFPPVSAIPEETDKEGARFVKSLRKYRQKITFLNIIILGFFLLVAGALVKIGWTEFLESSVFAVPAEDIKITELYQLAGGDIYCTLEFPKLVNPPILGSMDIIDKTSDKHEGFYELHCQYPLSVDEEKYFYYDTMSIIFPAEVSGDFYSNLYPDSTYTCTSINYRGKGKKDKLVIWEEGQTLEKAPKHIEEKAIQAYQIDGNAQKALDEMELIGETTSQDELLERFIDYYRNIKNPADCFPIYVSKE